MSEQTEKLIHIIMPDLLNYLEMVESGELIEKRMIRQQQENQKEDTEKPEDSVNKKTVKRYKIVVNRL